MGVLGLHRAIQSGEPLADVTVRFRQGVDPESATLALNALADDFDLHPSAWYGDPASRIGTATRNALIRLFGWRLKRMQLPQHPNAYHWAEDSRPTRYPPGIEEMIDSIGLTQPGADDDGQWYEWSDP